jgi:hypothetical protein
MKKNQIDFFAASPMEGGGDRKFQISLAGDLFRIWVLKFHHFKLGAWNFMASGFLDR